MSVEEKGLTLTDGYTHSFKTAIDCLTKEADAMDAENRVGRASMLRSIVEELQDAQQRRAATSPAGDLVEQLENIELAARNLDAYLKWQLSPESPGYAPTFPSAVAHFRGQFEEWVFAPGHARFEQHQKDRREALRYQSTAF